MLKKNIKRILAIFGLELKKIDKQSAKSSIIKAWFFDEGDKKLRLDYSLNETSIVFDVGGYEGQWASDIYSMYRSKIYVFEPVESFFKNIQSRFYKNPDVNVYKFGLSDKNQTLKISVNKDSSSFFRKGYKKVNAKLVCFDDFIKKNNINYIDLIKINIEGGEYDLLEHIISTEFINNIGNIQVQFHSFIPNANIRMENIQKNLSKTHELTYQYKFVWENWKLKNNPK